MDFLPRHSRLLLLEEIGENEIIRTREKTENLIFLRLAFSFPPFPFNQFYRKQTKLSSLIHKQSKQ